jgi:DNA topoisomerase-3
MKRREQRLRLFIAEKPSVGRAVASVLGVPEKNDGYLKIGDTCISWCFGHLLTLWRPEEIVANKINTDLKIEISQLPVIPQEFKVKPRDAGAAKQLNVLKGLLNEASEVVHAGDPDREGQLLVDEVLLYLNWRGPTKRLWLSSMDKASISIALNALRENQELELLSASAQARSWADWLVGMNASMALSRNVRSKGGVGAWSIGRVQTPSLALVVKRDFDIANFKPRDFYLVDAYLDQDIRARWQMKEDQYGVEDGYLLDKSVADALAQRIVNKPSQVVDFRQKEGKREAPLPPALSDLQKLASAKFGLSAASTLEASQYLYENGVISYPRTDSNYLPEEQHLDASNILKSLGVEGFDTTLKHPAWNTSKVGAHHAIIPTGQPLPSGADLGQKSIYGLVLGAYARLFFPPERFYSRTATFLIENEKFIAKSRMVLEPGWTAYGGEEVREEEKEEDEDEESSQLPVLNIGDILTTLDGKVLGRVTKSPRHYTDGTLIYAMSHIHMTIDDPSAKARLKATSGIGTEATRANIIEALLTRGYLERKKRDLRATLKGQQLVAALSKAAPTTISAITTATWEDALAGIASGEVTSEYFLTKQISSVEGLTKRLLEAPLSELTPKIEDFPCPECGDRIVSRISKVGNSYFACLGVGCGNAYFKDKEGNLGGRIGASTHEDEGEPMGPPCTRCKKPTMERTTQKGASYFKCLKNHGTWWNNNGELGKRWKVVK